MDHPQPRMTYMGTGWVSVDDLKAEVVRLREALEAAVYYAHNLERVRGGLPVRDLAESRGGYTKAADLLNEKESEER